MQYSQEEFFKLVEAVEAQSGEHLDKACNTVIDTYTGSNAVQLPPLRSCDNSTLFEVPYDALNLEGDEVGVQPIVACAVEDDMGRWPRFGGDKFAGPDHFVKPWDA